MKNAIYKWGNQRQSGIPGQQHWGAREQRRYLKRQARQQKEVVPEEVTVSVNLLEIISAVAFLTLVILGLQGNHIATLFASVCAIHHCWKTKNAG